MLSTKFRFIWQGGFRGEDFLEINQSETRIAFWQPCLSTDQNKMCNLYKGPVIDASYQVSVHLAEGFQRRRLKWEKLTEDGRQVMAKAHIAKGNNILMLWAASNMQKYF